MSLAVFRVMLLTLLRDRGARAMTFLLPPLIYLIFAAIFSGATGADLNLRVAVLDEVKSTVSQRLVDAIRSEPSFRIPARASATVAELTAMIRADEADAGVVLRTDPSEPTSEPGLSPIMIYGDPAKAMASAVIAGQVQRIFSEKLPDAAYRRVLADFEKSIVPFTPEQRTKADGILDFIARSRLPNARASAKDAVAKRAMPPLVALAVDGSARRAKANVVYYAGAVTIMFLMYAAMHGAFSLVDERQNGILDRILQSAGGVGPVICGKFLFLVLQGVIQASLIFAVAAVAYDVDVASRFPAWLAITVAASMAMAAFGLALNAHCRTRQQAQTLSTFMVLVLAALGGSMVPRFLMPTWLQDIGWAIPNAWVIEAYQGVLWRDAAAATLTVPLAALTTFAVVMLGIAWRALSRERQGRS